MQPRYSTFGEGVWMQLQELRETADAFCTMFDSHMFQLALGSTSPGDIRQFSLGTVYNAVKLGDNGNARVNFIFNFHPSYSWDNDHYWYSMSVFTGIQGMCWKFMANFLSEGTAPEGVVGSGTPKDTRGGWLGFGNGKYPNTGTEAAWRVRWCIDPWVPGSDEEPTPKEVPGEDDNGLPWSGP
ncbi:hypothetical protein ABW21_db0207740 [Orbilia brochopaga]|nr:hypothetical protein ABW21_db0207740 [Drechslerella brochopaga]